MKKKDNTPSGFDNMLGSIYGNSIGQEEKTIITDDMLLGNQPLDDKDDDVPPAKDEPIKDEPKTEDGDVAVNVKEDDSDIPEDVLQQMQDAASKQVEDKPQNDPQDDPTKEDLNEAEQVGLLFDAIGESLGWNMADVDEKERPLTVDDLTKYMSRVVQENSVPHYADESVQMLDQFIKNGGKFEDFYTAQQSRITIDNIDLEDENNQKQVVRELLKHEGYSDEQINKRIQRYEDADMLIEESEDALERLKTIRQAEIEENARQQQLYAQQQEEESKQFYAAVTDSINNMTNIRGIAVPREDRKALYDYIFKVDQNGLSQYQKDFQSNLTKNLIESAYFTMKADKLIDGAKQQGETSAAEKLRKMLRHSSKNHTSYNADEQKQKSVVDLATGLF